MNITKNINHLSAARNAILIGFAVLFLTSCSCFRNTPTQKQPEESTFEDDDWPHLNMSEYIDDLNNS